MCGPESRATSLGRLLHFEIERMALRTEVHRGIVPLVTVRAFQLILIVGRDVRIGRLHILRLFH